MPRIRSVKTIPLSIPYIDDPPSVFQDSWGVQLYVKVELDDSIGWGEVLVYGSGIIDSYNGVFRNVIVPAVINEEVNNVNDIGRVINKLEKLLFTAGLCGVVAGAIGGLEMALWDALSRRLGRTVSELLGSRVRNEVPVYASFPRYSRIEYVVKAVDKAINNGFTMVKLHQHVDDTIEAIKAVRKALGHEVRVALDLNAAFTSADKTLGFLNRVHKYEPYWVEEPTWPPNDYEMLNSVVAKSPVPIAAGENEYYMHGFKDLARTGVAYIQPDISKIGGIIKFMNITKAISSLGNQVAPHHRPHRSILTHTYTLHVASLMSSIAIVEWPLTWINEVYDREIKVRNGYIHVTDLGGTGVGLSVNEEALSKYPYIEKYIPLVFH